MKNKRNQQPHKKSLKSCLPGIFGQTGTKLSARQRASSTTLGFEQLEDRLALAVVINEFLAENNDGYRDAAGHRHDWIELKNTGVVAENISGWYLTDSSANLTKFQIPSAGALTTLDPGEILLVYASGNNGEVGLVGNEIHTNFQLSQEPGYLALVRSNGSTIEHEFNLYPQQSPDVSYGTGIDVATASSSTIVLVGDSSPLSVISPTGPNITRDDHWKESGFDDSGWLTGTGSVGFDRNGDSPNLLPFIGRVLTTGEMDSTDATPQYSAYVRYEFDVVNKEQFTSLVMNLRFDDGFIASLNGKEIARANFAEDFVYPQPQWNSYAGHQQGTSSSSGNWNRISDADQVVSFDITPYLELLQDTDNVLAFHGVNSRSSSSSNTNRLDFLIDAELVAERAMGATQVGFLEVPSPGRENGVAYDGVLTDTVFSLDRGFYDTTQSVAIHALGATGVIDSTATIRYTTDFSEPTLTNGTTYTGPISVSTTTVLRAKAFKTNFISTNVDTQTYIFLADVITQNASYVTQPYATWGHDKDDAGSESGYNLDDESDWDMDPDIVNGNETTVINALKAIPTISVVTNWDNLWSGTPLPGTGQDSGRVPYEPVGIYIHGRSSERPNSLEYFTADGAESFQVDSVIEIQGHSSPGRWNTDKMSFQVKFKAPLADPNLSFDLFKGTADAANAVDQFDTLILDAGYNYGWTHSNLSVQSDYARFVTDQVTADLQNLATGGAAPHGKFVHLYLDGLYWGLYNVHERPDEHFASDYFGGNSEQIFVVKQSTNDIDGLKYSWANGGLAAEQAYNDLLVATRQNMSIASNYEAVKQILDVDAFIDYMVVHMYAGNENDWPHNNWYATYDPVSPDGKWRFHAWDQEHAFPTNDNGDSFTQFVDLTDDNDPQTPAEVFINLIANTEFRLRFSDRVQELMFNGGVLTPAVAQSIYEARTNEIDQAIIGESARWGDNRRSNDPYTHSDFISIKNGVLAAFFPVRTAVVLSQFNADNWLVTLNAPNFNQYGGEITTPFNLTMTNPNGSGTIYYTLDGTDPRDPTGALSPSAIAYTGSINLTDSTRVRARVRDTAQSGTANDWSAEVNKAFLIEEPLSLRIVELMYNPAVTGDLEYFELLNIGTSTIDLTGVQITDFSTGGYTFAGGTLSAGERIVVAQNVGAFQNQYPLVTNLASTPFSGSLSNGGETVTLKDAFGVIIQSFNYSDDGLTGWPTTADGGGYSLVYVGPLTGTEDPHAVSPADPFDNPANWQASAQIGGSPGTAEPAVENADFNNDTFVSGSDFLIWQRNFGKTSGVSNATGDANGDNMVNGADLAIWQNQYGTSIPIAAAFTSNLDIERESATLQSESLGPHLMGLAGLAYKTEAGDTDANEAVFAEESVDFLGVRTSMVLEQALWSELSEHDEALSMFLNQESEEELLIEDITSMLSEDTVGQQA
mgnify:CR=1 FL=1